MTRRSRYTARLTRLLDTLNADQRRRYELALRQVVNGTKVKQLPEIVLVRIAERIRYEDSLR